MDDMETRFREVLAFCGFDFKQHQYDGIQWCLDNELRSVCPVDNVRGGFVVDEMGLGKTLMMLSVVLFHKQKTLIVVPPILLNQWKQAVVLLSSAPGCDWITLCDYRKQRTMACLESCQVVICSYYAFLKDDCPLLAVSWGRVVFDEAHHLRNDGIKHKNCLRIRAPIRWLVTGTPVQNRRSDLCNLAAVAGFSGKLDKPLLMKIARYYLLRRCKQEVGIVLPTLTDNRVAVPWRADEQRWSQQIHESLQSCFSKRGQEDGIGICNRGLDFGCTLVNMLRARQMCILPTMLKKQMEERIGENEREPIFERRGLSSKMRSVIRCVFKRSGNGRGKLIFCHFREEIDYLATTLASLGMLVCVVDGRRRSFDFSCEVLILQIQVGCEGLNLQASFSEVYFVSPHWNPCVEDQAIARCYRIGQTQPVDVFRFYMDGNNNLETYVGRKQHGKRKLAGKLLLNSKRSRA